VRRGGYLGAGERGDSSMERWNEREGERKREGEGEIGRGGGEGEREREDLLEGLALASALPPLATPLRLQRAQLPHRLLILRAATMFKNLRTVSKLLKSCALGAQRTGAIPPHTLFPRRRGNIVKMA
jgi:hypothetical protein